MTKQNKKPILSSKTLKAQLLSVIAMLVVASVALSSATYAWFVNNSTVTIETMQFQATTAQALLVGVRDVAEATATNGHVHTSAVSTGYKNIITNSDITTTAGWTNMFGITTENPTPEQQKPYWMEPASITNANLLNQATANGFYISNGDLNPANGLLYHFIPAEVGVGDVKRIPLSFSSSLDMAVYFGNIDGDTFSIINPITPEEDPATDPTYADQVAALKKAIRLAIVTETYDDEPADVKIFQFDATNGTTSYNNTDYSGLATVTATEDQAAGKYKAISTVTPVEGEDYNTITTVDQQTAITSFDSYIATIATDDPTDITAPGTPKPLFYLEANAPKAVTVYIWLEGTDPECLSYLSQFKFAVDLKFAGVSAAYTPNT